ncbi:MAG: hypothetical protein N2449_03040 [Bacteroidales bacterium]|nr:hypothetical protein [Bacteroidales bacterium]
MKILLIFLFIISLTLNNMLGQTTIHFNNNPLNDDIKMLLS